MKEIILLILILATFAGGYFMMGKTGSFIAGVRKNSAVRTRVPVQNIIIATQHTDIIKYIQPAMDSFTTGRPDIGFSVRNANGNLLQMIKSGRADMALIHCSTAAEAGKGFYTINIDGTDTCIMWAKNRHSQLMRQVATALRNNGQCLKKGYPDYID